MCFLHICQSHPPGPGKGSVGAIAGGVVAGVAVLLLGVIIYIMFYRRRKSKKAALLPSSEDSTQLGNDIYIALQQTVIFLTSSVEKHL